MGAPEFPALQVEVPPRKCNRPGGNRGDWLNLTLGRQGEQTVEVYLSGAHVATSKEVRHMGVSSPSRGSRRPRQWWWPRLPRGAIERRRVGRSDP